MNDPTSYCCPNCVYSEKGYDAWPCRCCERVNKMADYYTPADGAPTAEEETVNPETERLFRGHVKGCAECPATALCIKLHRVQPDFGGAVCLTVYNAWLTTEATK